MQVYQNGTVPAGQEIDVQAQCPAGDVTVGGGYQFEDALKFQGLPSIVIGWDMPYVDTTVNPDGSTTYTGGWAVLFKSTDPAAHNVAVTASCVPLSGDATSVVNGS